MRLPFAGFALAAVSCLLSPALADTASVQLPGFDQGTRVTVRFPRAVAQDLAQAI